MKKSFVFLLFVPMFLVAQHTKRDSIWLPLNSFIGTWKGTGEGVSGKGKYERTYKYVLGKKFIEISNKTTFEPSKENPKGEVHEDVGFFSYDKNRKAFVLRQFHIEGFVNQFVLQSISVDRKKMVFVTESIENIPKGYTARETYIFVSENEIEELFEIAEPNKEFVLYSKATLIREN